MCKHSTTQSATSSSQFLVSASGSSLPLPCSPTQRDMEVKMSDQYMPLTHWGDLETVMSVYQFPLSNGVLVHQEVGTSPKPMTIMLSPWVKAT